jgi:hypothetical protein
LSNTNHPCEVVAFYRNVIFLVEREHISAVKDKIVRRLMVILQPKKTTSNEKDSYVHSHDVSVCGDFGADGER